WLQIEGLEKHLERAEVRALYKKEKRLLVLSTKNISRLSLTPPWEISAIELDGQKAKLGKTAGGKTLSFQLLEGRWLPGLAANPGGRELLKKHGLQGPIDDAFMDSFVCVRPTGKPLHPKAHALALRELERLEKEFPKWLRGDVRVVDDQEVRLEKAGSHLVLFGDPGSNPLIAEFLAEVPAILQWNRQELKVAGRGPFDPATHFPMLIYPNPKDPRYYVVINSGHTFGEREFRGTNAYLFPRCGDYAVFAPGQGRKPARELKTAGFFDESWQP
ncbi:MAG: hypothetical protein VX496_03860, partial [Planctomycetota bacterium]|nr:hypothetical protein [Planctomycetota bacterium]